MSNGVNLPSKRKTYAIPIIFSLGFVLLSPLGLFAIFLSGDSCCGQNTIGTMIAVTAAIVILLSVIAVLLNTFVKLSFKRDTPDFTILRASLITAGPASLIHIGFVVIVSASAF
jgi:hypothetical protein